ncbi:thiamine pyrophosphate-binding protein [Mycolicibacterium sp. XJ1819]
MRADLPGHGIPGLEIHMKRLLEGSEALAEAMVAAGCRFFTGYPMTPFTELLEHMAKLLPPVDGTCINAESELEAVGMSWGAAATGTRAATGSVGQGLALMMESITEMAVARIPLVVVNMARTSDYFQMTRGGHGDARRIVLAPSNLTEGCKLIQSAFDLADHWRTPVVVMGDYYLAHVQEAVEVNPVTALSPADKPWALDGSSGGTGHAKILSPIHETKFGDVQEISYGRKLELSDDLNAMMARGVEPLSECLVDDDCELLIVAQGVAARFMRYVVDRLRAQGYPVGFFRPITLWPFPSSALARAARQARAVAVYELNSGQMIEDVRLSIQGERPVTFIGRTSFDDDGFGIAPDLDVAVLEQKVLAHFDAEKDR